jgi:hypothetical protein
MTGKEAVTIGTDTSNASNDSLSYGLYGSHAYAVIGYNSSNGTFTLYNPWGVDQPTQALTWAQLQTVCDGFVVANAAGTSSFASSAAAQFMLRPAVASRPVAATASAASDSSANLDTTATPQSGQDAAKGLAPAIDAVWSQCGSGFVPGSSASPFDLSSSIGNLYRGSEVGSGVQSQTPSDLSAAAVDELLKTWAND